VAASDLARWCGRGRLMARFACTNARNDSKGQWKCLRRETGGFLLAQIDLRCWVSAGSVDGPPVRQLPKADAFRSHYCATYRGSPDRDPCIVPYNAFHGCRGPPNCQTKAQRQGRRAESRRLFCLALANVLQPMADGGCVLSRVLPPCVTGVHAGDLDVSSRWEMAG